MPRRQWMMLIGAAIVLLLVGMAVQSMGPRIPPNASPPAGPPVDEAPAKQPPG